MNRRQRTVAAFVTIVLAATTLTGMASTAATSDDEQPWPERASSLTWVEPWLYFVGRDNQKDTLWRTNGPTTEQIDLEPEYPVSRFEHVVPFAGELYVYVRASDDFNSTYSWWSVEPDSNEPTLITEGAVLEAVVWGEWLYFSVEKYTDQEASEPDALYSELWRTDGTTAEMLGTYPETFVECLTPDGEWLYFTAAESESDAVHVWRTDGTELTLFDTVEDTSDRRRPIEVLVMNEWVYLHTEHSGEDASGWWEDVDLWRTDGSGTELLSQDNFGYADSRVSRIVALGDNLYVSFEYTDSDSNEAHQVKRTDGEDWFLVSDYAGWSTLSTLGDWVYFDVHTGSEVTLWRANGTTAERLSDYAPSALEVLDNWVYFSNETEDHGVELWRADGSTSHLVADLNSGPAHSYPEHLTVIGDWLYFVISTYDANENFADDEIWRTNGTETERFAPASPKPPRFSDVGDDHPFITQITWLAQSGITEGYEDGTFRPGAHVSRQAMAAFLYRAAGEPAFTAPAEPSFTDVATTHPFFHEVEWLAQSAITEGYDDGTFRPGAHVSRQAMAAFLYRLIEGAGPA